MDFIGDERERERNTAWSCRFNQKNTNDGLSLWVRFGHTGLDFVAGFCLPFELLRDGIKSLGNGGEE